jgi:hypothetical protein
MIELSRVTGPALKGVLGLYLDREGHEEAAAPCVPDSHPVPRLQHAEPDSFAVQGDPAAHGHVKGQEVAVDEYRQLTADGIDTVDYPDAL